MWEYTDAVREHFLAPHNVGELKDANAIGEVGSLACGDALKLFLKIENDRIVNASFQTFGCASAIASSSVLTDLVKGKTIDEALAITNKDIADALGGLPPEKMHCSVMGQEALEAAIRSYRGLPPLEEAEGTIVCSCFGVTEELIRRAIRENSLTSVEQVTNFTKAGGACGGCIPRIEAILRDEMGQQPLTPIQPVKKPLSNIERMQKVMTTLNELVRPRLQQDGGDVELIDIEGSVVTVALRGMCSACPSSRLTLEGVVQQILREQVDPAIVVREATA
ncbi:Fe-S cluster assembly protein NifU [Desulfovibrio sp. OttesenSCG-928-I05]|nr:Fe-S cluster assembly protein NifU [Desulfovibrio sp. OttesenSCG-928-I05]